VFDTVGANDEISRAILVSGTNYPTLWTYSCSDLQAQCTPFWCTSLNIQWC